MERDGLSGFRVSQCQKLFQGNSTYVPDAKRGGEPKEPPGKFHLTNIFKVRRNSIGNLCQAQWTTLTVPETWNIRNTSGSSSNALERVT
jgi:hypothetical protein